tara:strand:+ start:3456 stop:4082 length:627 start_codon:yes stop_codon:yes gene_type:complete
MTIADHHLDKREVKMSSEKNVFNTLNKVDVSEYTKKKGKFSYLSWCFAVQELLRVCPSATWEVHLFEGEHRTQQPYMVTDAGYFVQVTVDVDGVKRTQVHPVLDNRNQSIDEPNSFQINTSIQRCLAKAIALHGLGLYIFAGEDLPEPDELTQSEIDEITKLVKGVTDKEMGDDILKAVANGQVNSNNYKASIQHINKIIKEQKEEKK